MAHSKPNMRIDEDIKKPGFLTPRQRSAGERREAKINSKTTGRIF